MYLKQRRGGVRSRVMCARAPPVALVAAWSNMWVKVARNSNVLNINIHIDNANRELLHIPQLESRVALGTAYLHHDVK